MAGDGVDSGATALDVSPPGDYQAPNKATVLTRRGSAGSKTTVSKNSAPIGYRNMPMNQNIPQVFGNTGSQGKYGAVRPVEPRICRWNNWDPLEECIVGIAKGNCVPDTEPATQGRWERQAPAMACNVGPRAECKVDAAQRELDHLAATLRKHGVVVHRPDEVQNKPSITPYFCNQYMNGWTCPRDTFVVIGNEAIEAPMSWRSRYWEAFAYRSIFNGIFRSCSHSMYTAAPKPMLSDASYRPFGYGRKPTPGTRCYAAVTGSRFIGVTEVSTLPDPATYEQHVANKEYCLEPEGEILFDAADCLLLGKDMFMELTHTANELGHDWMRRKCRQQGIRFHSLHFPQNTRSSHIDAGIQPLRAPANFYDPDVSYDRDTMPIFAGGDWNMDVIQRFYPREDAPGKIILGEVQAQNDELVELLEANNWDILRLPKSQYPMDIWPQLCKGVGPDAYCVNMFTINPSTVVCEAGEEANHKYLEGHGFDVEKVPLRNVYEFGGAFNCSTLDLRRRSPRTDRPLSYFPTLD